MSAATLLRGPADADHYRVKVGRYGDRWYTDPLPADEQWDATDTVWPSVSSVKKADSTDWTYVGLKRVAQRLQAAPDALDGLDYAGCYDRLKSINKLGLDRAAGRGTQVHTYFEDGLRGRPIAFDPTMDHPEGEQYVAAVQSFFDTYRPRLVAAELVCINRGLNGVGYGGTGDAIIELDHPDVDPGPYWVDWKSRGADSDHGAYPNEAAQIAAYASADYYIADDGTGPRRLALPQVKGGLVVSIRPDGFRVYPVDLDKAVPHWVALHEWWANKRHEREAVGKPWAPRRAATPVLTTVAQPIPASPPPAQPRPQPQPVPTKPPAPTPTPPPRPAAGTDESQQEALYELIAAAPTADLLRSLWAQHSRIWTDDHTDLARARLAVLGAS